MGPRTKCQNFEPTQIDSELQIGNELQIGELNFATLTKMGIEWE